MDINLRTVLLLLVIHSSCLACFRNTWKDPANDKEHAVRSIAVNGKYFKDKEGRIRLFHGFNSVTKGFPWYSPNDLNETRLALYQKWGFNVVRLGCMWAGAQPNQDSFNSSYLQTIRQIVDKANEYGMYVILDMHQDVLSSAFGAYDGVPDWLIKILPPSRHPYPWPLPKISQWTDGYLTEAVGTAFQGIYQNKGNSWHYMSHFWRKIAQTFQDAPNVLGYELINEPWAGNIYEDPSLLLPGLAGHKNLKPLYDRLNKAIRSKDPNAIIFYEPVTWGIFLNGSSTGSGFDSVPGGPQYKDKSCFSYHYYCWALTGDEHQPPSSLQKAICDKTLGPKVFDNIESDIRKIGGTSFLTEFGLCDPDGKQNSTATVECDFVMNEADKHFQSWTYWDSGFFNQEGEVQDSIVLAFARVFPRAIAGEPKVFNFDAKTKIFHLQYQPDLNVAAPTEIYIPLVQYPHGFKVIAGAGVDWNFNGATRVLTMKAHNQTIADLQIVPDS